MKKTTMIFTGLGFLILVIFVLFVLKSFFPERFENYSDWKTVVINDCGSFKIPNEWELCEQNENFYIADKKSNPIFIQSYSYAMYEDSLEYEPGKEETNKFFNKLVNIKLLESAILSNGATYGKTLVLKDGEESERLYLDIGYNMNVLFIVWDDKVNSELLKKIAMSFVADVN